MSVVAGSNNSPSPHAFSDTAEEPPQPPLPPATASSTASSLAVHSLPLRSELKRPSPDTFPPGVVAGGLATPLPMGQPPKKPKVVKSRENIP